MNRTAILRRLYRLISAGRRLLWGDVEPRRQVITRNAGALSGTYEPDYVERLRAEWPE
ncbi:MAG TPA: hypothetical protein VGD84_07040 [Pseudonocardiaceae bacterium]